MEIYRSKFQVHKAVVDFLISSYVGVFNIMTCVGTSAGNITMLQQKVLEQKYQTKGGAKGCANRC